MQIHGLQVHIPVQIPPPEPSTRPAGDTVIGELVADGTTLAFASPRRGSDRLRFAFYKLRIDEFGKTSRSRFSMVFANPHPPGEVKASGAFGPVEANQAGLTPLSGAFELTGGNLRQYDKLTGQVHSKGTFHGKVERITTEGTALISEFRTNYQNHPADLRIGYQGLINGVTGDALVESVAVDFLRSRVTGNGRIESRRGETGKTVSFDLTGEQARIQDLLHVFTKAAPPAMSGPIVFRARVEIPTRDEPFLRRMRMTGNFNIRDARWKPRTQFKINDLSARARGDKEQIGKVTPSDMVASDMKGSVAVSQGLASLSGVSFRVPGATAAGGGTFHLLTKRVNIRGTVSMAADVSEATTGFKSVLIKPFNRLFRRNKKKRGATLPVSITGTYPQPKYTVGLKR